MPPLATLGTYSISILHSSLFYQDERSLVFSRPLRVHKGLECEYYYYVEDGEALKESLQKKLQDQQFIYQFAEQHEHDFQALMKCISEINQKIDLDHNKLALEFERYWQLLQRSQPLGDCFTIIEEVYLNTARKWVEERLRKLGQPQLLGQYMALLSTPWEESETIKQEIEFLVLCKQFIGIPVPASLPEFHHKIPLDLQHAFQAHLQKWCWIPHGYDHEPFSEEFLHQQLQKYLQKDVTQAYHQARLKNKETMEQALKILVELKANADMKELLAGLRRFTLFRTTLDLHSSKALHTARPFYEEIAKRLNLTFYELKFLTPAEIALFLRKKRTSLDAKRLYYERKNLAVEFFQEEEQTILAGKEAQKVMQQITENREAVPHQTEQKSSPHTAKT